MFRLTVINAYNSCQLYSMDQNAASQLAFDLIGPFHREKYPAITDREQAISIFLQVLYLAITDEIFVHIANRAAPSTWETIRQCLCDSLIHSKDDRVYEILILRASRRHIPA